MNYPSSDSGHRKIFILIDLQSIWNVHYNILLQKMLAVGFSYMIYWLRLDLPRPNICEKCSTCDNLPFPVPQPSNIWPLLTSGHASGPRLWFMFLCRWYMLVISPWWYRKDTKKSNSLIKKAISCYHILDWQDLMDVAFVLFQPDIILNTCSQKADIKV